MRSTMGGDAVRVVRGWQSPMSTSHVLARLPIRAGAMLCSCRYLVRGRVRGRIKVKVGLGSRLGLGVGIALGPGLGVG